MEFNGFSSLILNSLGKFIRALLGGNSRFITKLFPSSFLYLLIKW